MTIAEAIESLKDDLMDNPPVPGCRLEGAKKLGIEALKLIQWQRRRPYNEEFIILPGETEQ